MEGEEPQIINTLSSAGHSSKLNRNVNAPGQCYYCFCIAHVSGRRSRESQLSQGVSEQLLNQTGLVLVVTFG